MKTWTTTIWRAAWALCLAASLLPARAWCDPPTASVLAPAVVTRAVERAVAHAGLGDGQLAGAMSRARSSAWLPELRVRVERGWGTGLAYTQTTAVPVVERGTGQDAMMVDVRMSFALNRLVFSPEEVSLLRLEDERRRARLALAHDVVEALTALERASVALAEPDLDEAEEARRAASYGAARAWVETLTDTPLEVLVRGR